MKLRGTGFKLNGSGDLRGTIFSVEDDGETPLGFEDKGVFTERKKAKEFVANLREEYGQLSEDQAWGMFRAVLKKSRQECMAEEAAPVNGNGKEETLVGPTIDIASKFLRDISEETVTALEEANTLDDDPIVYKRGSTIARIEEGASKMIECLSLPALIGVMDRVANYVRGDNGLMRPARPPKDVAQDILTRPQLLARMPQLDRLSSVPVFLLDGAVLTKPGYSHTHHLYLDVPLDIAAANDDMDVAEAVALLLNDLMGDFPFVDDGSKAHALAAFIQPFARLLFDGPSPLYLIDAPSKGTGKGLLLDVISIVTVGTKAHVMATPKGDEETEKRITGSLLGGAELVIWDNANTLKAPSLAAALTTNHWRARPLGRSDMVELPNLAMWLATGNNVILSDELVRRVAPIRLDAGVERPEERTGFRHYDLPKFAKENRCRLVSACISLIRNWFQQGCPKGEASLGRFEAWCAVVGGILKAAQVPGFLSNRERLYVQSDMETQEWIMVCDAWWSKHEGHPVTAKDILAIAKEESLLLAVLAGRTALSAQQRIGHALATRRDRIYGEYRINFAGGGDTRNNSYVLTRQGPNKTPETPQTPGENGLMGGVSGVSGVFSQPGSRGEQKKSSDFTLCLECGKDVHYYTDEGTPYCEAHGPGPADAETD